MDVTLLQMRPLHRFREKRQSGCVARIENPQQVNSYRQSHIKVLRHMLVRQWHWAQAFSPLGHYARFSGMALATSSARARFPAITGN